ncbi:MAG: translation elongation factor Ts [Planctomycetes bacterium]|nr:translation elongation factor Ts [Planctomycetota bacterium]
MGVITAAIVKQLRDQTGLPMMGCKRALQETDGDLDAAVELLRKAGKKTMEKRAGRQTECGRFGVYTDIKAGVGTMIELLCESAPVASNEEFVQLAADLAKQLATGPGAAGPDELLDQPSPSDPSQTLRQQFDDLNNRIREVFKLTRIIRIDAPCAGYAHHTGSTGVLLEISGGNAELGKDVSMHVAAMRPQSLSQDDLDPTVVAKERDILSEAARAEGKPESIIEKMVDGRMRNFFAEQCLLDQPFVKDDKKSVGAVAKEGGMEIVRFVRWELAKV